MQPGYVLSNRYRLVSMLGRGGMGTVWRADHLGLHAPVAVKLLGPAFEPNPEALARFEREAQSAANLRSPHVVQILDHGIDEASQTPFIAMELMEGESLSERLSRVGRLSIAETSQVVAHVARALTRAHEIGHRAPRSEARKRVPGTERRRAYRQGARLRHRQVEGAACSAWRI